MTLAEILSIASGIASIAPPILQWGIEKGGPRARAKLDINKAFLDYKAELKLNNAILQRINLDAIDTRDIANPAVKAIASRLQTKAAHALLLSLLQLIQKPEKAAKALPVKKIDKAEAKKVIKAIISVTEKTRELQCFTTLSEAERKILKGFYARARLKHIKENTLYIVKTMSAQNRRPAAK